MDNKTRPLEVYIIVNLNNVGSEEEYTTENEIENNPQWGEEYVDAELLHIVETNERPTSEDPPIYRAEND
jgi:hypothetical protein